MKKVLVFISFAVFALSACNNEGPVIAKVGKAKITEADLQEKILATPPAYQNYINTPAGRKQFVEAVVRETIIIESAKQDGLNKDENYKNALKEFKAQQNREYKAYSNDLLMEMYMKNLHGNIVATDKDIEDYYKENKQDYDKPLAFTLKHILTPDLETAEAAKAALDKGEAFGKVATEFSMDTVSAANDGFLGTARKGELVPEIEKAVLALRVGEISEIVESPFGFHIVMKTAEETLDPISFEQAVPEIKRNIERSRFEEWFNAKKAGLGVVVNPEPVVEEASVPEQEEAGEMEPTSENVAQEETAAEGNAETEQK